MPQAIPGIRAQKALQVGSASPRYLRLEVRNAECTSSRHVHTCQHLEIRNQHTFIIALISVHKTTNLIGEF